jgi:serine/threonine-protein kinase
LRGERRLPWPCAVAIVDDVAHALEAAHRRGIIHRDVKPGNIYLARRASDVRAMLIDFGLALLGEPGQPVPQSDVQVVPGTPEYSSPEQARGEALDPHNDLYALGVTAYELVSGRLPFQAPTSSGVLRLQAYVPAPPLLDAADVPVSLARLIDALLRKDPRARPDSAQALSAILSRLPAPDLRLEGILAEHYSAWRARRPGVPLWRRLLRTVHIK